MAVKTLRSGRGRSLAALRRAGFVAARVNGVEGLLYPGEGCAVRVVPQVRGAKVEARLPNGRRGALRKARATRGGWTRLGTVPYSKGFVGAVRRLAIEAGARLVTGIDGETLAKRSDRLRAGNGIGG